MEDYDTPIRIYFILIGTDKFQKVSFFKFKCQSKPIFPKTQSLKTPKQIKQNNGKIVTTIFRLIFQDN